MPARLAVALVAVALILATGAAALDTAYRSSGQEFSVEDETFDPEPGQFVELEHSKITGAHYDEQVEVVNDSGVLVSPGDDYEWNDSTGEGTIKAVVGGALDGENNPQIDYGYTVTDEPRDNVIGLYADGIDAATPVVLVLTVALVAISLRVLGGVG